MGIQSVPKNAEFGPPPYKLNNCVMLKVKPIHSVSPQLYESSFSLLFM